MNKFVKGSIAGAAGITLLLGGLGSFALWNDSTTVTAGAVNSGELQIVESAAEGSWAPKLAHIVPGDTVTYTETFTVKAKGDNLHAQLIANVGEPASKITGAEVTTNFSVSGGATRDPANKNLYTFDQGTYEVKVTITVVFDWTTAGRTGQNQTFTPGPVTVSLEQVLLP
ncbi:alternate-type signal peptide domain-containing protein [Mycetocola miduiensis]|uniref:Alternate signal-mediated exported protein, RER_14450 family n=1 Tax=Mycetocola miduiensis TaxID=995034 RepID=A0A1I5B3U4_9MICO|nr:alternate-type signal peptide domain-containing protein [Mycetocola miduiensis]SFN69291.1 alternate signal-mediated exported protein, RER_14450 family [Mycetocola miduiensis]